MKANIPNITTKPPMLAKNWDKTMRPDGWWMSEKLDGVRAIWDGEHFRSRGGNIFHAPAWFKAGLPALPLDGELFVGRGKFNDAVSIVWSLMFRPTARPKTGNAHCWRCNSPAMSR